MTRWLTVLLLLAIPMFAPGCTGNKELGPVDASEAQEGDPAEMQQKMEEAMKHMPGKKMSSDSAPGSSAPAKSPGSSE